MTPLKMNKQTSKDITMTNSLPIVLVDGSSYLYRAYHALPPLANSKGMPTGAIKGVINMLKRLIKDYPLSPVIVIFDAKGKTFRDEIYNEYKAQRPPMPDDLRPQVEPILNIVKAMGFPLLVINGVEADDVIGTLAVQATACNRKTVISTGDKDMAQLVNDHVTLVNTMSNTKMGKIDVKEKYGFGPEHMIDYLALMGDKVDNIPGVPGVGEKTALGLLQGIGGGLDDIYNNLEKIRTLDFRGAKKMPEKLVEHREKAYLSYTLATIKTDVEFDFNLESLTQPIADNATLKDLYSELEFKSWVEDIENASPSNVISTVAVSPAIEASYDTVLDKEHFNTWLEKLSAADLFAFDTETTSIHAMDAEIVGVSFSISAGEAAYVPCAHDYLGAPEQLSREWVLEKLRPLLESESHSKMGQNLKYDRNVLQNHNIVLRGIAFDTMLESYVLNSVAGRHDMDSLALRYLNHNTIHFEDVAGKGVKQLRFNQVAIEEAGPYASEDADVCMRLHETLWKALEQEPFLQKVFSKIEMPLVPVLADVERKGVLVDAKRLGEQSTEIAARLIELEREVFELADCEFNLSSPKQLGEVLFEKLQLPIIKKTPKGAPSTAEDVLQTLALDYPLPKRILEYRTLAKLKSTYTDKLPKMINPKTGRIHTSYHQAVTATGRLSSSDPNLQNIPIRTAEGRRIRQAFIAPTGYKLLAADYSQIELRIMAHLSQDEGLLNAFSQGVDVHKATAAEVFGVEVDRVTDEMRRRAKAINFGLIYGMSAFGLGKQLNIGRKEAQGYIDRYFERYPGVARYMESTRAIAHEQGYVETIKGRRLYLPEINARNKMMQQAAERTAINAPMQGTAADIIKLAMVNVAHWLVQENLGASIVMQVHDELVLEVPDYEVNTVTAGVIERMEHAVTLSVPLLVEVGIGFNWDEAH